MRTFQLSTPSSRCFTLLAVFVLLFTLVACQPGKPTPVQGGSEVQPAGEEQPADRSDPATSVESPQGDRDLTDPAAGIGDLPGYRQEFSLTLSGTLQGNSYDETQTITREVVNEDEAIQAVESVTGQVPVFAYTARLGGFRYSQEREGAACRAKPDETEAEETTDPALRLPRVTAMQEVGQESLDGRAAVHFTFDERSLNDPEGVVKQAEGEVWLAETGDLLLQYELTVTIETPDFSGTRSWSYRLTPLEPGFAIQLPPSCQPVPADLPLLPEAADLIQEPGFQRYFANSSRRDAVTFYHNRLSALGWEPLPGSTPNTAYLESDVTVLSYAQAYNTGSRVLLISLSETGGRLQVIAQTVLTKKPVQSDVSAESIEPGEPSEEDGESSEPEEPADESAALPPDLPAFPGAAVATETGGMRMLQVQASLEDVVSFYEQELEALGWTLDQKMDYAGVTMMRWTKDGEGLTVTITDASGTTQIVLSVD